MAKIRSDFVTNSSSSSFIVLSKGIEPANSIKNEDELVEYILGDYGCKGDTIKDVLEENYVNKIFLELQKYLQEGYSISFGDVDYGGEESIRNLLEGFGFKIIFYEDF